MSGMSDKELLELAAKAAGIEIVPCTCHYEQWPFKYAEGQGKRGHWNPLTVDGDALRLASSLSLHIEWRLDGRVAVSPHDQVAEIYIMESSREDRLGSLRRAIVRAAAMLAQREKEQQP